MRKKYLKQLCIALAVILIAHLMAACLQTDFNRVRIRDIYLLTDKQQQLHALAFIPKQASSDHQLPCVITVHGGFHSAEMQDAACIELSRRGVVVIAIDTYSHGMSSNAPESIVNSIYMENGIGLGDMVDYVMGGNMDFIDLNQVAIMGHSMGTLACSAVITNYANQYQAAIEAAQAPDSPGGAAVTEEEQANADRLVEIKAAFCEGMAPGTLTGVWDRISGINIAFVFGIYEELNLTTSTGDGYLLESTEGLEMIHSADPSVTKIGNGTYYGSIEDGTLRVLYQPNTTHLTDFISPTVTAQCIQFFTDVFHLSTDLSPSNQLYLIKELFNLAALIGLFFLVIPFGELVLSLPAFASIRNDGTIQGGCEPQKKMICEGLLMITLFSLIGFLITNYIDTNILIFQVGPQSNASIFPLNECNIVMVWMLIFAAGNLLWFALRTHQLRKAGLGGDTEAKLKLSGKDFAKTLGAAAIVVGLLYLLVFFSKWMFQVDFRFWKVSVRQFNNEKLIYFIQYLPVWLLFMLSMSLLTNHLWCDETGKERRHLLLLGIGFSLGGLLVWAIQYGKLFLTGTVLWSNMNGVASVALKNWVLIISPLLLRYFYRRTGKDWLGPIALSVLFTLISVTTTTVQHYML